MADQYTIVRAADEDDAQAVGKLRDLVQVSIDDGWWPTGGAVFVYAEGRFHGYQALVREHEPARDRPGFR